MRKKTSYGIRGGCMGKGSRVGAKFSRGSIRPQGNTWTTAQPRRPPFSFSLKWLAEGAPACILFTSHVHSFNNMYRCPAAPSQDPPSPISPWHLSQSSRPQSLQPDRSENPSWPHPPSSAQYCRDPALERGRGGGVREGLGWPLSSRSPSWTGPAAAAVGRFRGPSVVGRGWEGRVGVGERG